MSKNKLRIMITFGQGHSHVVDNNHFDKDAVAVLEVNMETSVRDIVRIIQGLFGNAYANWHTEFEWAKMDADKYYPRGHIQV